VTACSPALRDPGELVDPTPGVSRPPSVEAGLSEAQRLFDNQDIPSVRRASVIWLRAAAADEEQTESLIGAVRAQAWLADRMERPDARRAAATEAVRAGQWCEQRDPDSAACAYWLAVALGVQARERRSTALDGLDEMIARLDRAIRLDPAQDFAGPERVAALVRLRAPGWPTGPGDPDLGLELAQRAAERFPDYPPNLLCLAEAWEATEQPDRAAECYRRAFDLARERFESGQVEARHWMDEAQAKLPPPGE